MHLLIWAGTRLRLTQASVFSFLHVASCGTTLEVLR